MKISERRLEIAQIYARLSKKLGRYPTRSEMIKAQVTWDSIRGAFGSMEGIRDAARDSFPNHFAEIIDPEHFNTEAFNELKAHVKKFKRFFISCVVPNQPVDEDAMASVQTWCKKNKGTSLFLAANYGLYDLNKEFVETNNIVFRDLKLNSNLWISTIKIDPKQIDPLQSLDGIGQREGTMIVASPKQRMRPVANSNMKLPHIIQATGAITKARYEAKVCMGRSTERRDYLAKSQHVMGGIIVEIVDDKFYHFRQVQFDKDGSFIDLFNRYDEDGVTFVGCEAVIQGDFHDGETDKEADAAADELCRLGKPKFRVFHDFFNGHSISHHDRKKRVTQAIKAAEHRLSLATELHNMKLTLQRKCRDAGKEKFVMSRSNHDEFLHRYLQEGDFEDHNRLLATKLQVAMMEGHDPLKYAMELMGLKDDGRMVWLDRDQDFKVSSRKIEVGAHGDLGANGAKGSSMGMLKAYGECMYGHCHYPEINHGAWSVGTSSRMDLDYKRGASSWMHSHGVVYSNGSRQLIHVINGKWRLTE
jgi:hypothetical protein